MSGFEIVSIFCLDGVTTRWKVNTAALSDGQSNPNIHNGFLSFLSRDKAKMCRSVKRALKKSNRVRCTRSWNFLSRECEHVLIYNQLTQECVDAIYEAIINALIIHHTLLENSRSGIYGIKERKLWMLERDIESRIDPADTDTCENDFACILLSHMLNTCR